MNEQRLISTNGIAKDFIEVSLKSSRNYAVNYFGCSSLDLRVTITSLVDKITIHKIVVRWYATALAELCSPSKAGCGELLFPKSCSKDNHDKTLALGESLSAWYFYFPLVCKYLLRISIVTNKGSFDYFYFIKIYEGPFELLSRKYLKRWNRKIR